MPRKSESNIVKRMINALEQEFGGIWWKNHGNMFGKRGSQDIVGCAPVIHHDCIIGTYVRIEVKTKGNIPSKLQLHRIKQDNKKGAIAFWADSPKSAVSQLKQRLEHIKQKL